MTMDVAALAESPALARLRHLDLSENAVTDAGAEALLAAPHPARGLHVAVQGNPLLSPTAKRRLHRRYGGA